MAETFIFRRSSNLSEAQYDSETSALTITFVDGSEYTYENVPPETYRGLTLARSAGQFFHRHIRDRFNFS
jgi:hypothetical protein